MNAHAQFAVMTVMHSPSPRRAHTQIHADNKDGTTQVSILNLAANRPEAGD